MDLLSVLKPLLAPLAMEIYNNIVLPELKKLDAQIKSDDLKIIADALLVAIEKIAEKELPKL